MQLESCLKGTTIAMRKIITVNQKHTRHLISQTDKIEEPERNAKKP